MGKKVDIDTVIAEIESAIAENGVEANIDEWIAEAKSLAKTASIAELDRQCDVHGGVPFIVETNICRSVSAVLRKGNISHVAVR